MTEFHDSNYYKRQRIIGRWALQLLFRLSICEMFLWVLFSAWKQYHFFGMRPSEVTAPYCFLGIGIFIAITEFFKLTRELEKFDAEVLDEKAKSENTSSTIVDDVPSGGLMPERALSDFPELVQAVADEQITQDGTLRVPRSEFVLYCHDHDFFSPRNKESGWKPIDGLLKDSRHGKPLIAKQFRQSYQDLGRDGKVPID